MEQFMKKNNLLTIGTIIFFIIIILTILFLKKVTIFDYQAITCNINNKEIDKELEIMCNLSQAIEMDIKEKTVRKVTREVTRQNNVRAIYNVMKNLNVSFDVAIDILDFTKNEKIILKEYLKNKRQIDLRISKQIEREVDEEIERVQKILHDKQNPQLF